jgi:hypothetical protein
MMAIIAVFAVTICNKRMYVKISMEVIFVEFVLGFVFAGAEVEHFAGFCLMGFVAQGAGRVMRGVVYLSDLFYAVFFVDIGQRHLFVFIFHLFQCQHSLHIQITTIFAFSILIIDQWLPCNPIIWIGSLIRFLGNIGVFNSGVPIVRGRFAIIAYISKMKLRIRNKVPSNGEKLRPDAPLN